LNHEEVRASLASPADAGPVKEMEMSSFLEDKSDAQAPDETPTTPKQAPAADPAWIAEARRYNKVQEWCVEEFNELTDHFLLQEGSLELDPKAVFDWQRAHGLDPDGKVGPRTLAAARAAKARGTAVAKTEQSDGRIPV
jgi:hypothetical protein